MDENRIQEFTRCVSKNGDLELIDEQTIIWAQGLSQSDKIQLYCAIRDESMRFESEWRQQFVEKVLISESLLPQTAEEPMDLHDFLSWGSQQADRSEVIESFPEILAHASPESWETARELIVKTKQADLLQILDEFISDNSDEDFWDS